MNSKPIGIFDSGAGGLSIWKEINMLMPNESTIYISDSKYAPYGNKETEVILKRSIKNTEILLNKGCKIIVVACNTATTNAIKELRRLFSIPFIGIEPAIKPAALFTNTNSIGILATKGTLSSNLFHATSRRYTQNKNVTEQIGDGIIELIESGKLSSSKMMNLLKRYLEPMLKNNIDCIVLGCTHYHFLVPLLRQLLPKNITIIDSGSAVAKQAKEVMVKNNLLNKDITKINLEFYTNGSKEIMANLMSWDKSIIKGLDDS